MTGYMLWTLGILGTVIIIGGFMAVLMLFDEGDYLAGAIAATLMVVGTAAGIGWAIWYSVGGDDTPDTGVVTDREFHDPPKGSASWSLRITDPTDLSEGWVRVSSDVFNECRFGDRWPDCSVGAS